MSLTCLISTADIGLSVRAPESGGIVVEFSRPSFRCLKYSFFPCLPPLQGWNDPKIPGIRRAAAGLGSEYHELLYNWQKEKLEKNSETKTRIGRSAHQTCYIHRFCRVVPSGHDFILFQDVVTNRSFVSQSQRF